MFESIVYLISGGRVTPVWGMAFFAVRDAGEQLDMT